MAHFVSILFVSKQQKNSAVLLPNPHFQCTFLSFLHLNEHVDFLLLQETLSKLSPVAYVDLLEGDAEGYVRFHSPEEARVVSDARAELQKEHSWKLEILSGEALLPILGRLLQTGKKTFHLSYLFISRHIHLNM